MQLPRQDIKDPNSNALWLTLGEELDEILKSTVRKSRAEFNLPATLFANSLLRAAIHTQLTALGDREKVAEWLERQAATVRAQSDLDLWNLADEDEFILPMKGN